MLTIQWAEETGWEAPRIQPCTLNFYIYSCFQTATGFLDGRLSLEPSSTVLHYAQTIFEGMKAYRDETGKVTMFRPDLNMERMNTSASRIALPVRFSVALFCFESRLIIQFMGENLEF